LLRTSGEIMLPRRRKGGVELLADGAPIRAFLEMESVDNPQAVL
jgi:hypothetical protein